MLRCYNNFHQHQYATNICVFLSHSETLHCENKLAKQGVLITQRTKSKSLFELFKERVIVNFGDYFCCIHIFSTKLLICSQTFVNLKYIQKLEISYEFDVHVIFTPMYGGFTYVMLVLRNRCFISYYSSLCQHRITYCRRSFFSVQVPDLYCLIFNN